MLLSYTIIDFHLFYDGALDIQIWAPLTRSQCKVSDTQVTVKACGPLVVFSWNGANLINECKDWQEEYSSLTPIMWMLHHLCNIDTCIIKLYTVILEIKSINCTMREIDALIWLVFANAMDREVNNGQKI